MVHFADKMVKDELKIVQWVQFMRVTKHALNHLLTKEELNLISEEAKFKLIAFDKNDEKVIIENTLSEPPPKESLLSSS